MITNDGKELISKFLIGQAPEYATHIAIGCGATPLGANDTYPAQSEIEIKKSLDFEMTRFPISSKGFVDENGSTKIVFTAEMPTDNRYDITEVALWSAASNNLATNSDSKVLFNFSEPWQSHAATIENIPYLENIGTGGEIDLIGANNAEDYKVFSVSSSNQTLRNNARISRKEGPRFLNRKIMMRGDTSSISGNISPITDMDYNSDNSLEGIIRFTSNNNFSIGDVVTIGGYPDHPTYSQTYNFQRAVVLYATSTTFEVANPYSWFDFSYLPDANSIVWLNGSWSGSETHIHLNSAKLPISQNSSSDVLRLAISLIDKDDLGSNGLPDHVKILLEFYKNEVNLSTGFAKKEIYIPGNQFDENYYAVIDIPISQLVTSQDFTSSEITVCRIFSSVIDGGSESSNFYICLDGFRIDNINTENPLYKMVGYSVIKDNGLPVTKYPNVNNYIEFRLELGTS